VVLDVGKCKPRHPCRGIETPLSLNLSCITLGAQPCTGTILEVIMSRMDVRQLDRLIRVFSAIVPPLVAGCGSDVIDTRQFTEDLCAEAGLKALDAVEPAESVEYLALRDIEDLGYGDMSQWSMPRIVDESGERCSGASDALACTEAFDALPPQSEFVWYGFDSGGTHRSVPFTRGDEVGVVADLDTLRSFLGPIDAPGDAALLAIMQGHVLVCDAENDVGLRGDGYVLHTRSGGGCGEGDDIENHVVLVRADGTIEVVQTELIEKTNPGCAIGRLPAGLFARRAPACGTPSPVGSFWAEVAHPEAAAVTAFGQLASELVVHGAPRAMVESALRSQKDEIRHARVTARLARRYGGRPVAPRVAPSAPRRLAEVASDNAVEGCIRETYGALVAHTQARQARDSSVRMVLGRIARDETRHAALSWQIAQWAESRMRAGERRRVRQDTKQALDRLEDELTQLHADEVHAVTGLPRPPQARALYRRLREELFSRT
jgi:hypothetical protein